jgi:hypothetical protein
MPSNSLRRRSLSKAAKHHELAGSHELSPDDNQITRLFGSFSLFRGRDCHLRFLPDTLASQQRREQSKRRR